MHAEGSGYGTVAAVRHSLQEQTSLPGCIVRTMKLASRITAKGQVTIPVAVRRALDLNVGDEVIFELDPGSGEAHAQVRKAADFLRKTVESLAQPPPRAIAGKSRKLSAADTREGAPSQKTSRARSHAKV